MNHTSKPTCGNAMCNVNINRPVYNANLFHNKFDFTDDKRSFSTKISAKLKKYLQCSVQRVLMKFLSFFPCLLWLPKYKCSEYFIGDLISGWTVGIIRIPQGMAYALLAGVAPVYGLYTSFFSVLLWFVFSTSKHTSVGTMAIVCLMVRSVVDKYAPEPDLQSLLEFAGDGVNSSETINGSLYHMVLNESVRAELEYNKIQVAASITMLVGFVQLCMGFLHLGFLANFLSDPVVQGFTTGSAFHVMTSQVKYMFGLDKQIGRYVGPFALFKTYRDVFINISEVNVAEIVISLICLPTIFIVKYFNDKYKEKMRNIPFPIELLLVIIGTIVCHFGDLNKRWDVNIVSDIPTGFPAFEVPKYVHLWGEMVIDAIIIAIVSFAITMSLTKIFADKHGYEVDVDQELIALGACNVIPAFLSSFAIAASLSRTAIQESSGGHTQLVSILSSVLMLTVLLWFGPLFESAPKTVLACIIVAALKGLFMQLKRLKPLWKTSKIDFVVWNVSMIGVIFLGVDLGLAVGVGSALGALLFRGKRPQFKILGRLSGTDFYADVTKYPGAIELNGIKIFSFMDSPSYSNKEMLKDAICKALGFNPALKLAKLQKANKKASKNGGKSCFSKKMIFPSFASRARLISQSTSFRPNKTSVETEVEELQNTPVGNFSPDGPSPSKSLLVNGSSEHGNLLIFIFDASKWSYIDTTAGKEIISVTNLLSKLDVAVYFAAASGEVLKTLSHIGLDDFYSSECSYVTLHDACVAAEFSLKQSGGGANDDDQSVDFKCFPDYPGYDALAL